MTDALEAAVEELDELRNDVCKALGIENGVNYKMPNWCAGNIRFRGKKKDIKRFLLNEIVCCSYGDHEVVTEKPIFDDQGDDLIISLPKEHGWFYISGTERNFIDGHKIEVCLNVYGEEDEDKEVIVCIYNFKVAWSFDRCSAWMEFAKKYCFDVKLTGYESGMLFSQTKTIFRDGKIKDELHEYEDEDDWRWNCPQPDGRG